MDLRNINNYVYDFHLGSLPQRRDAVAIFRAEKSEILEVPELVALEGKESRTAYNRTSHTTHDPIPSLHQFPQAAEIAVTFEMWNLKSYRLVLGCEMWRLKSM